MKTKISIFTGMIATIIAIFIITGCKKNEEPAPTPTPPTVSPTDSTSQTTRASDQSNVENESNQAMDDVNGAFGQVSTTRGIQACSYDIDSSLKAQGKITLNYNGVNCGGKIRTGSITAQLPYSNGTITTWSTVGATATLTFNNYKVVYPNGKSVKFNGIHKVTNVNGGGYIELVMGTPIVHKVRSNMQISFDNATAIEWNSAKLRTFTYTGTYPTGVLKATVAADSLPTSDRILMWGINTMGDHFVIKMPVDYTIDLLNPGTNCIGKPLTGQIEYTGITYVITITYGVDNYGYPTTSCPYGYKVEWDGNNQNYTAILPY